MHYLGCFSSCLCLFLFVSSTYTTCPSSKSKGDESGASDGTEVVCLQNDDRSSGHTKRLESNPFEDELRSLTSSECFRTVTDDAGEITSPNWPRKSTDHLDCEIDIVVAGSRRIKLKFDQFDLIGGEEDCTNGTNYIRITDSLYDRTETICGSNDGFAWTSDGNKVSVVFKAEAHANLHIFHATYTTAEKYGCGGTFLNPFGMFSHSTPASNDSFPADVQRSDVNGSGGVCELLFHTSPNEKISVTFEEIVTLCDGPLMLYDPWSGKYSLICGTYNDVSWTSTGNELLVRYSNDTTRDITLAYEHLSLQGSSEPYCQTILQGSTGRFSSPFRPTYYPSDPECWTVIHASLGSIIQIIFETFSLGSKSVDGECTGDYVQISDITTNHMDRVCGPTYPFTWTSDSNEALVVFRPSEDPHSLPSYEATYRTIPRYKSGDCFQFTEEVSFDILRSRGFPDTLPSSQDCQHLLHTIPGKYLVLEITDFDLGDDVPCHTQFLEITDVIMGRTEILCGVQPYFVWTSTSNEVLLRLVTAEEATEGRGFSLAYKEFLQPTKQLAQSDCKSVFDEATGSVIYPLVTGDDCSAITPCDCLYVIRGSPGTHVNIHFSDFIIDPYFGRDHPISIVQILEPSAVSVVPSVEDLAETEQGFTWTSRLNELHIRVIEYGRTQGIRINAGYQPLELEGGDLSDFVYLTDKHGVFSVPSNCINANSTVCHVLIHASPSERILISFDHVNMTADECRLNSVEVTDLLQQDTETICSDQKNFSLMSLGNELLITFQQSLDGGRIEARFSYVMEHRPPANGQHLVLSESEGEISSRAPTSEIALPGETAEGRESSVIVVVKPDERVVLRVKNLFLASGGVTPSVVKREVFWGRHVPISTLVEAECLEGIKIEDLTTGAEELICGEADHYSWTSATNAVRMNYNISSSVASYGFRATYEAIPRYDGLFSVLDDPTGFIPPSRADGNYTPNTSNQWLIHAKPGDIISLVTFDFIIEDSPQCSKDFVKIEDQYSGKTTTLCGSHQTVWVTDSNEVLVTFESDGDGEDEGFIFSYEIIPDRYTAADCFYRFASESGEFEFGEDEAETARSSGTNVFCQFIFEVGSTQRLRMTMSDLEMRDCNIAELIFVDAGTYRHTEVCQLEDTIAWTSDLNGVILQVLSLQRELPSFVISWEAVDRASPTDCYIALNEEESILQLSSIQSFLDRPNRCVISINYKPGNRVIIALHNVITTSEDCSTSVTIEDSVSGRSSRWCDVSPGQNTWTSDSNEATVTIEQSDTEQGITEESKLYFNSTYRAPKSECSKTLTDESGLLMSVGFPDHYPSNQNCSVLLHASRDQRIRVIMQEFALEGNKSDCGQTDLFKMTDLSSLSITAACGLLQPFSWTSSGNELLLDFISDTSLEEKGYQGTYEVQPAIRAVEDCNTTLTGDSGDFMLPNFQAWYHLLPYVQCNYLIQVHPSQKIFLSFDDIDLFSNSDCSDTYAVIYDVVTSESIDICGERSSFDWTSSGNEVEIRFETFAPRTDHKMVASYRVMSRDSPADCDEYLSFVDASNVITSEGFDDGRYFNDQDCTYTIEARANQIVEITFDHFDLEDSEACQYDYVEVKSSSAESGSRFCGTRSSFPWQSDDSVASVTFHSDHLITRRGFTAHYEFISLGEITTGCNQNLTDSSGNFTSPGFPSNYGYNLHCNYTIRVEEGKVVLITFDHFELEPDVECKFDFIELKSLPDGRTVRFCGQQSLFNWTSSTNEVLVSFSSDGSGAFPGFAASYTAIKKSSSVTTGGTEDELPACSEKFVASAGFFSSPSFPSSYGNSEDCRIDYTGAPGSKVIINLLYLDLEYEPSCEFDYIQFVDVEADRRSSRMCGQAKKPTTWMSEGNHVTIIFHSDEIVQQGGFYGLFTEVPTP